MRATLAALLLLASAARAEDWDALVRAAAAESPGTSRDAVETLRRAGPGADDALSRAASSADPPVAAIANLLAAARRWDPEARLRDIGVLRGLDGATREEAASILAGICGTGSWRGEAVVRRILADRAAGERAGLLRVLVSAPARDAGWADVGSGFLRDPDAGARCTAAEILGMHGSWRHAADLRLAANREDDPTVVRAVWRALVAVARGPEDLPPLPAEPVLLKEVLNGMTEEYGRGRMIAAAWEAWERRRTSAVPPEFGLDVQRLARMIGPRPAIETGAIPEDCWSVHGPIADALFDSPLPSLRRRMVYAPIDTGAEFCRAAMLLEDPDERVRLAAVEAISGQMDSWDDAGPQERMAKFRRLAAAARIALEAASGPVRQEDAVWAVRELLAAAAGHGRTTLLTLDLLQAMGADAMDILSELRADQDLGVAAAHAWRYLWLGLDRGSAGFEDGLGSRPWLDGYEGSVDSDRWRRLAESEDGDDRWYAASMAFAAADSLEHGARTFEVLLRLCEDPNPDVAEAALEFMIYRFPDRAPAAEELHPRDAWTRRRDYVKPRLGARLASLAPLDHGTVRSVLERGDRALALAAIRADRFAQPYLRDYLRLQSHEPGLLPLLLESLEEEGVESWPAWCSQMAACGPDGCRMLAAVARTADPKVRAAATAALLSVPWGAEAAVGPLDDLAAMDDQPGRDALYEAVRGATQARPRPFSRSAADAVARAILRIARRGASLGALQTLLSGLGPTALSNASPELLALLTARSDLVEAAVSTRAGIGPIPDLTFIVTHSSSHVRGSAQDLYQGSDLALFRLHVRIWLNSGSFHEPLQPWRFGASHEELTALLLDEAAGDEDNREILLEALRRMVAYQPVLSTPSAATSVRPLPGPLPAAFRGDSETDRLHCTANPETLTVPEIEGLLAAALRGAPGDHHALDAIASRLGPDAVPLLAPLLGRSDPAVRSSAACAVARAAGPARAFAAEALRAAAAQERHPPALLRMLAALARLGDPAAEDTLRHAASSQDADERLLALHAIAVCPSRPGAFILATLADDFDAVVRGEASRILAAITGGQAGMDAPLLARAAAWRQWLEANPGHPVRDIGWGWTRDLARSDF